MFGEYLLKIKMQLYVKCVCAVKESMQNNWMVELSKYYITIKHFWKSWIMFTMGGQEESKNKLTTCTFLILRLLQKKWTRNELVGMVNMKQRKKKWFEIWLQKRAMDECDDLHFLRTYKDQNIAPPFLSDEELYIM
jgi:hypothetical protein